MATSPVVPFWWRQDRFHEFSRLYQEQRPGGTNKAGKILLFIGSGLSINVGLPNWHQLLTLIAEKIDLSTRSSRGKAVRAITEHLDSREYLPAGDVLFGMVKGDQEWRHIIRDCLVVPNARLPSPLHEALAKLQCNRIITTNFDTLIEKHYRGPNVIVPSHDAARALEQTRSEPFIYKIHGDIDDDSSPLVLRGADYKRCYKPGPFKKTLMGLIRSSELILFLGYGHEDPYIQEIWKSAREGHEELNNAFALVPIEDYSIPLQRADSTGIKYIGYSKDDDYAELRQFLDYLHDPVPRDEEFRRAESVKRPTVVLVRCGGTIGASSDDEHGGPDTLSLRQQKTRFSLELENQTKNIRNWYRGFYNAGEDMEIDLEWEVLLPIEWQMFSENATAEYWSVLGQAVNRVVFKYMVAAKETLLSDGVPMPEPLASLYEEDRMQYQLAKGENTSFSPLTEKEFILHICNRYLMGVVLLVGTDTLAYSASALSLIMHALPCPVVITGANQPAVGERPEAHSRFLTTSDAYKNVMTSLYFLQSFGHSLTEVFVCFGDTVHHGVNLRKVSTESFINGAELRHGTQREPFMYRNFTYHSQYMFKMIGGLFCNNFYPRGKLSHATLVGTDKPAFAVFRHIRPEPFLQGRKVELVVRELQPLVWQVEVTPAFPNISLYDVPDSELPRIVLVEGYVSGTFPSVSRNRFSSFLQQLYDRGIPVLLTAPFGIQHTQATYKTERPLPGVRRLYGILTETALPTISLIVGQIEEDDWTAAGGAERRIKLIEHEIDQPGLFTRNGIERR